MQQITSYFSNVPSSKFHIAGPPPAAFLPVYSKSMNLFARLEPLILTKKRNPLDSRIPLNFYCIEVGIAVRWKSILVGISCYVIWSDSLVKRNVQAARNDVRDILDKFVDFLRCYNQIMPKRL